MRGTLVVKGLKKHLQDLYVSVSGGSQASYYITLKGFWKFHICENLRWMIHSKIVKHCDCEAKQMNTDSHQVTENVNIYGAIDVFLHTMMPICPIFGLEILLFIFNIVTVSRFYQSKTLVSIYRYIRCDHESCGFQKLTRKYWICQIGYLCISVSL